MSRHPELIRTRAPSDLQIERPLGPRVPSEPHPIDRMLAAEQQAINDHASGGYDVFYLLQRSAGLPYEEQVDAETERLRADAAQSARSADVLAGALVHRAVTHGVAGRGRVELDAEIERLHEQRDTLAARRTESVDVLEGREEDGSGRNRTAPVPTSCRYGWWVIRRQLLTVVVVLLEAVTLFGVFGWLFGVEDPSDLTAHPDVLTAAVLGALIIPMPALVMGVIARGVTRNREHRPLLTVASVAIFAALLVGWLTVLWLTSNARAHAFGDTGVVSLDPAATDPVSEGLTWLMFVLFVLLGMITMVHQGRHNWHVDEVVKLNAELARIDTRTRLRRGEWEQVLARVALQEQVRDTEREAWLHHIGVTLPAIGTEVKRHYRNELIRRFADPAFTGALGLPLQRAERTGAVEPAGGAR